jgi:probable F420-dependent oxidoreductase
VRIGIQLECQEAIDWGIARRVAHAADELGFDSLWCSDHVYSQRADPDRVSVDPFLALAVMAAETERVELGTLVTAIGFRPPAIVGRMAAHLDALSGGRFTLGIGAGWGEGEHRAYGVPFPPLRERLDRLEEVSQLLPMLWQGGPVDFEGTHYRLDQAYCYPRPVRGSVPLLIGGSGRRTIGIAARHADEWNVVALTLDGWAETRAVFLERCAELGRDPAEIRCSQVSGVIVGRDEAELHSHLERVAARVPSLAGREPERALGSLRRHGWLVGTPGELVDELGRRAEAGQDRMMLEHHTGEDLQALELLAAEVLPQL